MTFLYKCRRCGAIDRGTGAGDDGESGYVGAVTYVVDAMAGGVKGIGATSIHLCKEGELACGVSDLIGFEPEK